MAGVAAIVLFATMLLPWYQLQRVSRGRIATHDVSAFGVFSFVEAAVLLVVLGVLFLLFARRRGAAASTCRGGDGTVVFAAGVWAAFPALLPRARPAARRRLSGRPSRGGSSPPSWPPASSPNAGGRGCAPRTGPSRRCRRRPSRGRPSRPCAAAGRPTTTARCRARCPSTRAETHRLRE